MEGSSYSQGFLRTAHEPVATDLASLLAFIDRLPDQQHTIPLVHVKERCVACLQEALRMAGLLLEVKKPT